MNKPFERRKKENEPVLAICYDFDKTLSPDDMQAQGYIQSVGYNDTNDFWKKAEQLAMENDMDQNLAYMFLMMEEADGKIVFSKEKLQEYGSKVKLFPGVEDWFERIREYGKELGVIVEHYIISSGLKEMIEGTSVAQKKAFEKIYASSFYSDNGKSPKWPSQVINYTNKTQFLFRIEKGVLDVNDPSVNDYFAPNEIRVPFKNIVYIGDSATDVPCMKLVNSYGGHSIGVYNPEVNDKTKVLKMLTDNRIRYFAPADYTDGSELDELIKAIIVHTASSDVLENKHFACACEAEKYEKENSEEEKQKQELIFKLESSWNFATTHVVIGQLAKYKNWTEKQTIDLAKAALENAQVRRILDDEDIFGFFKTLLMNSNLEDENVKKLKEFINELQNGEE